MKAQWERLAARINARSLRERGILLALAALALVMLADTLVFKPQRLQRQQLEQRIKQDQATIAATQTELRLKAAAQTADPDRENRSRLAELNNELNRTRTVLQDRQRGLVAPERMPALLEDVVRANGALRLVSLRTLPPISLLETQPAAAGASNAAAPAPATAAVANTPSVSSAGAGAIYKHRVELVVQGRYLDLMQYLTQLEDMPWDFSWEAAALQVDTYPLSTMTLTISTLSLDKRWLHL